MHFWKITTTLVKSFQKLTKDKIIHLLWGFTANTYPPWYKQSILQPKNPNQFVSIRFVDRVLLMQSKIGNIVKILILQTAVWTFIIYLLFIYYLSGRGSINLNTISSDILNIVKCIRIVMRYFCGSVYITVCEQRHTSYNILGYPASKAERKLRFRR